MAKQSFMYERFTQEGKGLSIRHRPKPQFQIGIRSSTGLISRVRNAKEWVGGKTKKSPARNVQTPNAPEFTLESLRLKNQKVRENCCDSRTQKKSPWEFFGKAGCHFDRNAQNRLTCIIGVASAPLLRMWRNWRLTRYQNAPTRVSRSEFLHVPSSGHHWSLHWVGCYYW